MRRQAEEVERLREKAIATHKRYSERAKKLKEHKEAEYTRLPAYLPQENDVSATLQEKYERVRLVQEEIKRRMEGRQSYQHQRGNDMFQNLEEANGDGQLMQIASL